METSMSLTGSGEGSSEQSRQQSVESGHPQAAGGRTKLSFNPGSGHINLAVGPNKRSVDHFNRDDDVAGK